MAKKNDCWGIEVGANAIKAVRLVKKGEDVNVAEWDVLPFKKVLTTPDINVDEQIQLNLDQFLSRHRVDKSTVMLSVPGHMAFARFAKLPPVEPKKIPDIVKFEAVQQIPFPINDVEWDYQIFAQPDSPDVEVGIVAITRERVAQFLANYQAVGMHVDGLTLSSMAVYNAIAYDMELTPDSPGVIIVDVGTVSTDVIIVENGRIWLRPMPIGGNNFTDALVRAFKLSFPKAERLKREAGTSKYARQIFQAMRPVFADLLQEMQRSLGYYQSLYRDAKLTKLIGVGSTFRLPGMQKFLKQQLQIDVVRPDGFHRLRVEGKQEADFADNAVNLVTAYGLALQGLGVEKVTTNILPRNMITAQLWRAKQPWLGAAAASLLLASGAAGARLWLDWHAFDRGVQQSSPSIDSAVKLGTLQRNNWTALKNQSDPRPQIENYQAMLDYRELWPDLMTDLAEASKAMNPQPALLTSDYDAIRQVPLRERQRLYINQIGAQYRYDKDAEIEAVEKARDTAARAPGATGTAGAARPAAPAGAAGTAGTPAAGAAAAAPEPAGAATTHPAAAKERQKWPAGPSPVVEITVRGTTPYYDAPQFISRTFIDWLNKNADRRSRPYRIYVLENPTPTLTMKLLSEDAFRRASSGPPPGAEAEGAGGAGPTPGRPTGASASPIARGSGSPSRGAPGASPLRPPPGSGGTTGGATAGGDKKPDETDFVRPPETEAGSGWEFTLRWKVQLVKPEDARQLEAPDAPAEHPTASATPANAPDPRKPAASEALAPAVAAKEERL